MTEIARGNAILDQRRHPLREHAHRLFYFGLISGTGLAFDLLTFVTLLSIGLGPFGANLMSCVAGVCFVYFASVRRVFRYRGRFLISMFAAYAGYHSGGILFVSAVLAAVCSFGPSPFVAKLGILPFTFGANYLFMSWLTSGPIRWERKL
jgi:putative flippase GtrA